MAGQFNPALHPRGPNGRFTRSFARRLGVSGRKKAAKAQAGFKGRKPFRSPADAHAWLSGLPTGKDGTQTRTFLDHGALKQVNDTLRAGKTGGPGAAAFDKAMGPLPEGVTVFRRVPAAKFGHADPKSLVGFEVRDAGYFPTTVAPARSGPGDVQLSIDVPAGTRAASSPDTSELILDRDLSMTVTGATDRPDGGVDMHVTVLDGGGATPDGQDDAPAPAGQAAPAFDDRVAAAAAGDGALEAIPASLDRDPHRLTEDQWDALESYRDIGYTAINAGLRGQATPSTQVRVWTQHMDAAMASSHLSADVVTYRGVMDASTMFGDRLGGDLTGMEWREDAFVSTSADRAIADEFTADADHPDRAMVMRLLVPAGTGAVAMSGSEYESEALLDRGLRMRVVTDHGAGPPRVIDVEVVPDGRT